MLHNSNLLKSQVNGIILLDVSKEDVTVEDEAELYQRLVLNLEELRLPIEEVNIELRPFSKTYYGRYFPSTQKIYVYPYENEYGEFMKYSDILCTVIHEMVHHIQHQDPNFKRRRGIMHNPQFWQLYNHFVLRAIDLNILKREEVKNYGKEEKC